MDVSMATTGTFDSALRRVLTEELKESIVGVTMDEKGHLVSADNMNPKDRLARQQGKAPLHYLEPAAEEQIARAMESGAVKYGYRNYTIEPIKATVYIDAILRHVLAWKDGEDVDEDSWLHPLAHIGANVHVALAAMAAGKFIDDRGGEVIRPEKNKVPVKDEAHYDITVEAWDRG